MLQPAFWRSGKRLLALVFSGAVAVSQATTYSQFMEADGWQANSSVLECSLAQGVPYYGRAVFKTRAGENSQFYLDSDSSRLESGQALLFARSPVWMEQAREVDLGLVSVQQSRRPIELASRYTERMLAELFDGLNVIFTRRPWYGAEQAAEVAITSVGFRPAYRQYLACLAGLLPVNFDQIERTSVYFGSNQFEDIRSSELEKLDTVALYVKSDPSVNGFFIDGHTDSVGTREANLELAKSRADEVKRYLVNQGVDESRITSRWHGERYPVDTNDTVDGRANNRRVTIRLEQFAVPQPPNQ